MDKIDLDKKRSIWAKRVELQKKSGLIVAQWCRENNVNYDNFLYWKKRVADSSTPTLERSSFQEIEDNPFSGISIEYKNVHIHLNKSFDVTCLLKCLEAIQKVQC
ncbi:MAG: IS66 family insertion sequence element accessory protein TnpA [Gammaproteobacteria bacterium]